MKDFKLSWLKQKEAKLAGQFPALKSSQDPQEVKLRVKSALLYIVPLIIALSRMVGVDVGDEKELVGLADILSNIIMYGLALYASVLQAWGWLRKNL